MQSLNREVYNHCIEYDYFLVILRVKILLRLKLVFAVRGRGEVAVPRAVPAARGAHGRAFYGAYQWISQFPCI